MKDEVCAINLDAQRSTGKHWTALYVKGDNVTYFDIFGDDYFSKEIHRNKNHRKIYRNKYLCNYKHMIQSNENLLTY